MARRIFTRINSFLSYKYFDRKSREYWQDRYKARTNRTTSRGWNYSSEFRSYRKSIPERVIKYAERNPRQFFEKRNYVLKYSNIDYSQTFSYGGSSMSFGQFLNPLSGKWGLEAFIDGLKLRATAAGKSIVVITRMRVAEGLEPEVIEDRVEVDDYGREAARQDIARNYRMMIAQDKESGTYELMGANYNVEMIVSSTQALAIIDMELFYY